MKKLIEFTPTENEVLQKCLAKRLKYISESFSEILQKPKSRVYNLYVGSVQSVINKLNNSNTCELTKWEKLSCKSVVNDEYYSTKENISLSDVYNPDLHNSILKKCHVVLR